MRLRRVQDHQVYDKSLYTKITPFLALLTSTCLSSALLWPAQFGVENRWHLTPLVVFFVINVTYTLAMRHLEIPVWVDRARVAASVCSLLATFYNVNPSAGDLWIVMLVPIMGQATYSVHKREAKYRYWAFVFTALVSYGMHFPFVSGNAGVLSDLMTLFCVGAVTWQARNFGRLQNLALSAAYNKLAQNQQQVAQSARFTALGEMSSGVAHEINNALTLVICGLEDIHEFVKHRNSAWELMEKHMERMDRATIRIQRVVSQLRLLSRDVRSDPPAYFDLKQVLDDALYLSRSQLTARDISWNVETPSEPIQIYGHESEICQVILNLVNNARDALESHSGPRKLSIQLQAARGWANLRICDNGPGIPKEVLACIYKPFVTTKPAGRGTGLGLSVSYGIVSRHAGRLTFETAPNEGTRFSIELPLASGAAAA